MGVRFYTKEDEDGGSADWVEITNPSGDIVNDAVERIKRERPAEWAELEAAYEKWASEPEKKTDGKPKEKAKDDNGKPAPAKPVAKK